MKGDIVADYLYAVSSRIDKAIIAVKTKADGMEVTPLAIFADEDEALTLAATIDEQSPELQPYVTRIANEFTLLETRPRQATDQS